MLNNNKFKKQSEIIVSLLTIWVLACVIVFFYYSVIAKEKYIKLGNKIAKRVLFYYPERAKIVDENGIPLAWSEKYYDLHYNNLTGSPKRLKMIYERIKNIFPECTKPCSNEIHSIMLYALQAKQIIKLEKFIHLFPELQISPRCERKVVDYPKIKRYIGQVKFTKGHLVGICGLENIHNKILSGTPGKYQIMLDRNKKWIKNSGQSIKMAIPGKDIKLKLTLEEIRNW